MKYAIYGAGYRGRRFFNYIGDENVVAFIDMDKEKQGKEYCGKPVISIEEYCEKYCTSFIVITPNYYDIEQILERQGLYQHSNIANMPSEFEGYGKCRFEDAYEEIIHSDEVQTVCCYGINVLSFLIYDYLCKRRTISICPEKNANWKKIKWIEKYHPEIRLKNASEIQKEEIVLTSVISENEPKLSNRIINLFEHANNNRQYWNGSLAKFKEIYTDKKCFIVATGPSLCMKDLYVLKKNNVFSFGVNSILKIREEWHPDAYVVTDSYFINSNVEDIGKYDCACKFIGDSGEDYWKTDREDSYKIHIAIAGTEIADFSEEICQKIYTGYGGKGTVTYVCIQIAAYMGFSEIYLLGVDCNYVMGSKNNYFIACKAEDNMNHGVDSMIKAYEYAKQYADSHGIKIYNATRGGMLEVFERVDFDSLF